MFGSATRSPARLRFASHKAHPPGLRFASSKAPGRPSAVASQLTVMAVLRSAITVGCPRCLRRWSASPQDARACEGSLVCPRCLSRWFRDNRREYVAPPTMTGVLAPRRSRRHWIRDLNEVAAAMRRDDLTVNHGRVKVWVPSSDGDGSGEVRKRDLGRGRVEGFLEEGGAHIEKAGATGNPVGRPTKGITGRVLLRDLLVESLDGVSIDRAADSLRRGRLTEQESSDRRVLAEAVARLYLGERKPNRKALADLIGCSQKTVGALMRSGAAQITQNSPKGGGVFFSSAERGRSEAASALQPPFSPEPKSAVPTDIAA
jgi:hypothetical protein